VDRKASDAATVGGEPFRAINVQEETGSGFTHFLDGAQKALGGLYLGMSPISLVHSSAAVCERVSEEVQPPAHYSAVLQLLLPNSESVSANYDRWRDALRDAADALYQEEIQVDVTRVN